MASSTLFKRNLCIVAGAHLLLVILFFASESWHRKIQLREIAWIESGSIGGGAPTPDAEAAGAETARAAAPIAPPPEPSPPPVPEPRLFPVEAPAPSELVIATPPPATPRPATPKPATPRTTPVKPSPKPATPKPATPKPATPKPKATPKPESDEEGAAKAKSSAAAPPSAAKAGSAAGQGGKAQISGKKGGNGPGAGNGKGPAKNGNGDGLSQFGWYFSMLHDRFHARWEQPTNIDRGGAEVIATLKLRISKDGVISEREIVKPSGYPQMDESVLAAARKVEQIDPLPAGLGNGDYFEVNLQFKLDQGQ